MKRSSITTCIIEYCRVWLRPDSYCHTLINNKGITVRLYTNSKSFWGYIEIGYVHVVTRENSSCKSNILKLGIIKWCPVNCISKINIKKEWNQSISSWRNILSHSHSDTVNLTILAFPSNFIIYQRVWAGRQTRII